jgi:predicted acylesterase/phospholipase RssA
VTTVPAPCRILAVDGGGVRGVVAALVLAELERRAQRPVCRLFDLVAGTSTGAVLALGLLCPDRDGGPRWTARQMVDVYAEGGPSTFRRSPWRAVSTVNGFLAPKYDVREMDVQLSARLGETRLSQALCEVLVPTYDLRRREPHVFRRSDSARLGDPPMRLLALASAAAPTYFAPVLVPDRQVGERWLVDGGLYANNPALLAYAEAQLRSPGADVLLVSVGCGRLTNDYAVPRIRRGGALVWARPVIDMMLDGQEDAVDAQARQVLQAGSSYWRFQADLPDRSRRIDDGSPANMRALQRSAQLLLERDGAALQAAADRLVAAAGAP